MQNKVTSTTAGIEKRISPRDKVIRFEGKNSDLLWKICGDNLNPDVQISVPPTHDVIIIKDGTQITVYSGGLHKIFESVKKGFLGLGRKVDATTVDILFVNKTVKVLVDWGTKTPVLMRDPLTDIPVRVRGNGVFEFGVFDTEKFYKTFVGTDQYFSVDSLKARLSERIMGNFVNVVSATLREQKLSYADLQLSQAYLNKAFPSYLNSMFIDDYGVTIHSFTISVIGLDEAEERKVEAEINRKKEELRTKQTTKEIVTELERLEDRANARADERDEIEWKRSLTLKTLQQADYEKYIEVQKLLAQRQTNTTVVMDDVAAKVNTTGVCKCSKCGKTIQANASYCNYCGEKITKFCHKCGFQLHDGDKFCPNCGTACD